MIAKILSLNIGVPEIIEWNGKSITTSMRKFAVPGPLLVHEDRVDGNFFADPRFHGTQDGILYVYGMNSIQKYFKELKLEREYHYGELGETLTVGDFDENEISVGDIFRVGEVRMEATLPRVPCAKLNFRMQHPLGQKAMIDCGVSGVYFRILEPGRINMNDEVGRLEPASQHLPISEVYQYLVGTKKPDREFIVRALQNKALPERIASKWRAWLG